jgi:hypothetical protein
MCPNWDVREDSHQMSMQNTVIAELDMICLGLLWVANVNNLVWPIIK